MNVFYIVLLALCPLRIVMNISVGTTLQDSLEDVEDEDVLSRIWKVNKHSWNRTVDKYLVEFIDIVIDTSKTLLKCGNCLWPKSRDGKVYVPYIFDTPYTKEHRDRIRTALLQISLFTCLRFVAKGNQQAYIKFDSKGERCQSFVGRLGRMQQVWLAIPNCVRHNIIQHEMMHALGFVHEHSRSDRDEYIQIFEENIEDDYVGHFAKKITNNMGTPYDLASVMHYGRTSFSKNGKPTILALSDPNKEFGQLGSVTEIDVLKMNKFYDCQPGCGKLMFTSTGTFTSPNYPGFYPKQSDCKWLIRITGFRKILLEFTSYQIRPFLNCLGDHLTVHEGSDYTAPKLFGPDCGAEIPLLMSTERQIFVVFRSKQSTAAGFSAKYKPIPVCGEMKTETSGQIRFQRPYSSYHKEQCTWVLLSPRAHMIIWTLTRMEFPMSENCKSAYVRVTDTAAFTVKGTYCGELKVPLNLTSFGRSLLVEYFHDAFGRRHRFRFNYKFVKNPNFTRFNPNNPSEGSHHNASGLLLCILLIYSLV